LYNNEPPLRRYAEYARMNSPRSRRVGLIAGYYQLTAVLSGLGFAVTLAFAQTRVHALAHPLAFASWPFSIATCWLTGRLIGQRQRLGAWIAVTSIGLSVLSQVATRPWRPVSVYGYGGASATILLWGAFGLAAIASVWKELE
jgi:hypothetical protein